MTDDVLEALKQLKKNKNFIPLHEPIFEGNEKKYVNECIDSTFVSSVGNFVDQFEEEISNYTGSKNTVVVVNGTSALHIALILLGVKPNDEVLMPALTFVATANAVKYCNAIPHFIDVSKNTLGIDPNFLEYYLDSIIDIENGFPINKNTRNRISCILPVHTFGHPCEIEKISSISKKYNIPLLEDAAESLGSFYNDKHTGSFGDAGIFSFNGNKTITTGGGGAIISNNQDFYSKAKHLTTTAKVPHKWNYIHDKVGYNYRLPNLNAALGCAQIENLDKIVYKKRKLYKKLRILIKDIENISLFSEPKNCRSNYWLQTLILEKPLWKHKNKLLSELNNEGIMSRPVWNLICNLRPYESCPKSELQISVELQKSIINIPSSPNLYDY